MRPTDHDGHPIPHLRLAHAAGLSLGTVRRLLDPRTAPGCELGNAAALVAALRTLGCPASLDGLLDSQQSATLGERADTITPPDGLLTTQHPTE